MAETSETFTYTYSATEQDEVKRIREKYAPPTPEEDKMERLRQLDRSVTKPGRTISVLVGTLGILLFGIGMCCTLVWADRFFGVGIIIGLLGMGGMAMAYPLHLRITEKQRHKLAPEIIQLTDELMK